MSTIVTRTGKGSPLTYAEADANFTNLNTDKLEIAALAPYQTIVNDQNSSATWLGTAAGTNTYTATASPAITAYTAGQTFKALFTNANTGAATININSLGAKSLSRDGATALSSGDIVAGSTRLFVYDGTQFVLQNPASVTNATNATNLVGSGTISSTTTATTQTQGDNSTKLATTAYVDFPATTSLAGIVELATGAEFITGTDTGRVPAVNVIRSNLPTEGTVVATTSGTTVVLATGLPTWIKQIVVSFENLSTNGASILLIQAGDATGGYKTSGYTGSAASLSAAPSYVNTAAGVALGADAGAVATIHGTVTLTRENSSSYLWVGTLNGARSNSASIIVGACSFTLSGPLDRIRLTTVGGTDTFDLGSANIMYL